MINKDGGGTIFGFYGGDTAVMRGDIELMGGSPPVPPTRENPDRYVVAYQYGHHYMSLDKCSKVLAAITLISLGVLTDKFGRIVKIKLSIY